jgi:hypothetical protein
MPGVLMETPVALSAADFTSIGLGVTPLAGL